MIHLKTEQEIDLMKEGGVRLREVVKGLRQIVRSGITTKQIDKEAASLIKKIGGEPSFKRVSNYYWSTCLPVNEQIVHTPPSGRILKEGDVLTLDIGVYFKGFHTDYADMIVVGKTTPEVERFLQAGKKALSEAIKKAVKGARIGDISSAIQTNIESKGFSVVRELTGHGIGRELHEDPYIPGFLDTPVVKTPLIKPGLTIAIEVIYAMGGRQMVHEKDNGWSIRTKDRSLSACFEHTVAITDANTLILT